MALILVCLGGGVVLSTRFSSQAAAVAGGACSTPSFLTAELIHQFFSRSGVVTGDFNGDHHLDLVELDGTDVAVLLGNGSGSFAPPIVYHLGPNAGNLVASDLNNDGKLDVVVRGNASSGDGVIVLLGNGAGSFAAVVPTTAPVVFRDVVLRDFDNDGKVDVATSSDSGVWIMFGDGSGSFGTPVQITASGNFVVGVEAADLNGDGKTDLMTLRPNSDEIRVVLNDGNRQFNTPRTFPTASASSDRLVVGDYNLDGKVDVLTAGRSPVKQNNISVLLGDGAGNLEAPIAKPTEGTDFLLPGDFNGDGKPDLVQVAGAYRVFLGDGTGHFGAPRDFNRDSWAAVAGDFNEDGKLDVASDYVTVAFSDGAGGLIAAPRVITGTDPKSVATGDFNEDGRRDLVVANGLANSVSLLLRNETGGYGPPTSFSVGLYPNFVAVADFNGDHHLDFVATNNAQKQTVSVRLGDGTGNFAAPVNFPSGNAPDSIVVGDFNKDGKPDLAVVNLGWLTVSEAGLLVSRPSVAILIGDGAGGFAAPHLLNNELPNLVQPSLTGTAAISIAAGDLNNDSKLDLVVANGTAVYVLLGDGAGNFSAATPFTGTNTLNTVVLGDFDNDGKLDVATGGGTVSIRLGDGSGNLGTVHDIGMTTGWVIGAADFNSDNNLDLVVTSSIGVSVVLGDGAGNFGTLTGFRVGGASVAAGSNVVDDLDGDGKPDIATPYTTILYNICGASVTPTPTPTPSPTATPTPTPTPSPTPFPAPVLLTEEGSNRAVAFDSVTLTRGPFAVHTDVNFSPDQRTRILLFAMNTELLPGEDASSITVKAENAQANISTLVVESVRPVPGFNWMTQLAVKLPDELQGAGDVKMSITFHGVTSNKAIITIKSGP